MKYIALAFILSLGSAHAQDCESLTDGLRQTLEQTQSLERVSEGKAAFRELLYRHSVVRKTDTGVAVEVVEERSQIPEDAPQMASGEESWLSPFNLSTLSCEGAKLTQIDDGRYQLELDDTDEATPAQSHVMTFMLEGDNTFLEETKTTLSGSGLPVSVLMTTTFSNWTFEPAR